MKNQTIADREQYVAKDNDLIRKARYSLTVQQQKIVLYAISKIKPTDDTLIGKVYTVSIKELCRACGMQTDGSGYYYKAIKDDFEKLMEREIIKFSDDSIKSCSWIGDVEIKPKSGIIKILFNPHMERFLIDLRGGYTQYRLENALVYKSKYAIRLYEILRSYITQEEIDEGKEKEIMLSLAEIRAMLDVDGYPLWTDFRRKVLDVALTEINACSDEMHVDYDVYKDGKTVSKINFILSMPKAIDQLNARCEKRKRLNKILV